MIATINNRRIVLKQGDITEESVDAIANAANSRLAGGGGVDGAIHRAGGASIRDQLARYPGCPTGSAVATGAGRLDARFVFHAVGPRWSGGHRGEPELLAAAYRRCMELAAEKGCASIAFPSISTGIYGYPVEEAAPIALQTIAEALQGETSVEEVRFVLFDSATMAAFEDALEELQQQYR